jgi:hypothetical protein
VVESALVRCAVIAASVARWIAADRCAGRETGRCVRDLPVIVSCVQAGHKDTSRPPQCSENFEHLRAQTGRAPSLCPRASKASRSLDTSGRDDRTVHFKRTIRVCQPAIIDPVGHGGLEEICLQERLHDAFSWLRGFAKRSFIKALQGLHADRVSNHLLLVESF